MRTQRKLTNTNPLRKLKKVLQLSNASSSNPIVSRMYDKWVKIYKGFLHRRFKSAAAGDGTWPPLARPKVVKRTKSGKRDKRYTKQGDLILIDTKTLINAVDPTIYNAPGSFSRRYTNGVIVGYGGEVIHPTAEKSGRRITIQQIAEFHQAGGGSLPQRKIIVPPDLETILKITKEINKATAEMLKDGRDK